MTLYPTPVLNGAGEERARALPVTVPLGDRPLPPVRDPAGGGMPRRAFSPLLPSDPVALSPRFHGATGELVVIYDQSRCMSLGERLDTLLADIRAEIAATTEEIHEQFTAFQAVWAAYEVAARTEGQRLAALRILLDDETTPDPDRWVRARAWLLAEPDAPPPDAAAQAAYQAAQDTLVAESTALGARAHELIMRQRLRIISDVVVEVGVREDVLDERGRPAGFRLSWPWGDTPALDPRAPDTFRVLDPLALEWIVSDGVAAVIAQVRGPFPNGR